MYTLCWGYTDLSARFPELDDAISLIESDAQSVADWAARNGPELNKRKTKAMIKGSLQYTAGINPDTTRKIKINGTKIYHVSSAKNLGINVTSMLNWKPHVSGILGKVFGALGTFCFHRKALSYRLKMQLVKLLYLKSKKYVEKS